MTHAIFTIGLLEFGSEYKALAEAEFKDSYELYINGPYYVWLEVLVPPLHKQIYCCINKSSLPFIQCPPPGCVNNDGTATVESLLQESADINSVNEMVSSSPAPPPPSHPVPPCPNFITGAGGFLQSVLYGHMGLRYNSGDLSLNPVLPANTTRLAARSISYLGHLFDLEYDNKTIRVTLMSQQSSGPKMIVVDKVGAAHPLQVGVAVSVDLGQTIIRRTEF